MQSGNYSFIGNELRIETAADWEVGGQQSRDSQEKGEKSERRMPRLPEARKDVVSCEKARGSANRN